MILAIPSLCVCSVGCGEKHAYETVTIHGSVVLGDKPIGEGRITYFPLGRARGGGGSGAITNGAYRLTDVPVGSNAFTFSAIEFTGKTYTDREGNQRPEQLNPIPKVYQTDGIIRDIEEPGLVDFTLDNNS
ncbi:MAG: hypothetical protein KDA37_10625 [Planctomycetales bacterium]|nr:hypothetical protein [Planctomycetales bacterium]